MEKTKASMPSFAKLGKKERLSIVAILVVAFILGLLGSVVFKNLRSSSSLLPARQKLSGQVSPPPATPATLSLKTKDNKVENGQSFRVEIYLDSPDQGVEAADFVVTFDPMYLSVEDAVEGNYFKNYPINNTHDNFVKLSGVATLENNTVIVPKGDGIVGTITFTALKNTTNTSVKFDRVKTIVASAGTNILDQQKIVDLNISIDNFN